MIERSVHFNLVTALIISILLFFPKSFAQIYPDKSVHQILKSGISLIIDQKYDEAEKIFNQLDKSRRDIPLGKIYLAAIQIAKSYDYATPFNDKLITKYLEDAKKISERLIKQDDHNIWNHYFFALTQGYISYYDALSGSWFSAFSTGLSSVSAFNDCLEMDKKFYESLIAIGSYKFWKGKKTDFINWLPFIPDEKDLGIEYLQKAIKYSSYNSHLAVHSLIWIYIEQENYKDAIKTAELASNEHPQARIFKWGLARAYENIDPKRSIMIYQEILNSYPKEIKTNKVNEVTLKHLIAQQLVKIDKREEAILLCDEILSVKDFNSYEMERLGNRIERVKELKAELSQK